MLPLMWRSVVQVMPTGLFSAMYTCCCWRRPTGLPSTRTSSPSLIWVPSVAVWPLTLTRPCSIQLSASRREQAPVSLMYLFSLMGF